MQKDGFVSANDLSKRLGISISTVRRDLMDLEENHVIIRTRGGASLVNHELSIERTLSSRLTQNITEKKKIGKMTAELVQNSGCIILDTSTTTLEVARCLKPKSQLRVITDSLEIAYELKDRENVTVLLSGGILNQDSYNMYGSFGEHMLSNMHAQVCVMGATGLTLREGLTKHEIEALPIRKKMIDISHRLICLVDSSKFSYTGLVSVCPLDRVDVVVTDRGIKPDIKKMLEESGIEVLIAD